MKQSMTDTEHMQNRSPWIRRHRILALLLPFAFAIVFFSLLFAINDAARTQVSQGEPGAFFRFWDGAQFGFGLSVFGLFLFPENSRLGDRYWLAYPFYVLPAIVFFFARRTWILIAAYIVYCLLAVAAVWSGINLCVRLMP